MKRKQPDKSIYPYEYENKLINKIKNGDVAGGKAIVNDIIGCIFFTSGGNIDDIKSILSIFVPYCQELYSKVAIVQKRYIDKEVIILGSLTN